MTAKHLTGDAPDELPGQSDSGGGGSGEANTASNVGTGEGVFQSKVGVNLRFKTLKAGANVTITSSTDELLIAASSGGASDGDKGDITVSGSGAVWTIDNNTISNAKAADVPTASFKGRATAGAGDPEDLTTAQATALLNTFTSVLKGLVPASGGGTTTFLRADGTFAVPPTGGAGLVDGDYGDVVVGGSGTTMTVDSNVISNAKLGDVPTATFKGRTTAGTGDPEDLTGAQATALLNTFTSSLKGLAPASGGGTANFLRADGTWTAPPTVSAPPATATCLALANGTSQTFALVANTDVLLILGTAVINPSGAYSTANGRFTPNVAGYYEVYGQVAGLTAASQVIAFLYKNGVFLTAGTRAAVDSGGAAAPRADVNTIVFMNGTTDYLNLYARNTVSGNTFSGDGAFIVFHARLIAT